MDLQKASLAIFAIMAVCSSYALAQAPAPEAASDLAGTTWQLVKFQGMDDSTLTPDDKAKYTVIFNRDGGVSVRVDCNRGRGSWKSSGQNQLELGPLALTRAMCPPGSLHDQIVKQWPNIRSYTIRDGHLFLALMADGGIYEYEPQVTGASTPAADAGANSAEGATGASQGDAGAPGSKPSAGANATLENTYWKLISLGEAAVTAAPEQREAHFVLNSEVHRVSGSGGCNRIMGSYQTKGDELTFSQMASTMMACAAGMATEKEFLAALGTVLKWKINGEQLELSDSSGKAVARFEARYMK